MTLDPRVALERAHDAALALARRREQDPLRFIRWLPLQLFYLTSLERFRLLRAGNQSLGKTTVALADLVLDALGEHPYRPCKAHGEYWVICASWSQSVAIQQKLHALIPPGRVKEGTVFSELRGYRGKNPAVEVLHKDGSYSIIRIKTSRQGSLNLASATIRGALFDEPPTSESVYGEVVKRVQANGGWVSIAMTPIGAPCEWIRELAEKGGIKDIHSGLTPEAMIPVGGTRPRRLPDGTVCDADWIKLVEKETPPSEVDIRVHGQWETRAKDRYFTVFQTSGPGAHVNTSVPSGRVKILLGIDHGHRPTKQIAVLIAVTEPTRIEENCRVWVIDEYTDTSGLATPKEDIQGIMAMLARNGMAWGAVDWACGDRVHEKNTAHQKSNKDLQAQLSKFLRIPPDSIHPQIRTASKVKDSPKIGCRWLYQAMQRPGHFNVNPKCKRTIEAIEKFLGPTTMDDEWHDPVDALRYGLQNQIWGGWKSNTTLGPIRIG